MKEHEIQYSIHNALLRLSYLSDVGMSEMIGLMRLHVQEVTRFTSLISSHIILSPDEKDEFQQNCQSYGLDSEQFLHESKIGFQFSHLGIFLIKTCAAIHDIGKPFFREIYSQPRGLTKEEFEIQKYHTNLGRIIIRSWGDNCNILCKHRELLNYIADVAISHQEKYDGTGYPDGLIGKEIPLMGRILVITDVISAIVNERPYKKPVPVKKCMEIMKQESGTHFDPELLLRVEEMYNKGIFTDDRVHGKWVEKNKFSKDYFEFIQQIELDKSKIHKGDIPVINELNQLLSNALKK